MSSATPESAAKPASPDACPIESFTYDDRVVRLFASATVVWGLLATLAGVVIGLLLVLPQLTEGQPAFAFGRLRPIHTNTALFAFIGNAVVAAVFYSTQRLCKTRLFSHGLGLAQFWLWQMIIVAAVLSYPLGITQGKEFAEMAWPLDIALAIAWLFFAINFFGTLARRRERHMYVSLWFYIASIITVGVVHSVNNLVLPTSWVHSFPLYAGVHDAMMQWWYGHNLLTFLLTMPFLGFMYYFLPKAAERPLYSYRLCILHFWSMFLLTIWAGPHHLHYTSIPGWASTLGMLFGFLLWMPSWAGVINGLMTVRGSWDKVASDPILKFLVVALCFYGLSSLESALLAIKSVNAVSQYTDWMIAHMHTGALGWNGFLIFGMVYWLLPRLFRTELWSAKLVSLHFWVGTLGVLLYVLPIYAAGISQGLMWRALDDTGNLVYPDFISTMESIIPLWWIRIFGGALYSIGLVLLAANTVMTWCTRSTARSLPIFTAARYPRDFVEPHVQPASRLADAPVLELGKKIDIWTHLSWHRAWERMPLQFSLLIFLVLVLASIFELAPTFLIRANVPTIDAVQPYTPLELAGRQIYIAEGCYNCHSQQVRPLVPETKRYGEYSAGGEFVYDRPFQWGSRRIGPDLAREGGRNTSYWHWTHLADPREVSEGSVMPSFRHLLEDDLDYGAIAPLVEAAHELGAPYSEETLENYEQLARDQAEVITADIVKQGGPVAVWDKQAIALIAYIQRLGTDRFQTAAPESATETPPSPPAGEDSVAAAN